MKTGTVSRTESGKPVLRSEERKYLHILEIFIRVRYR